MTLSKAEHTAYIPLYKATFKKSEEVSEKGSLADSETLILPEIDPLNLSDEISRAIEKRMDEKGWDTVFIEKTTTDEYVYFRNSKYDDC